MTCKECVHYEVCEEVENLPCRENFKWYRAEYGGCPHFKPKSRFVEVVRCKDCTHYHKKEDSTIYDDDYCDIHYYCDGSHRTACEQDFCSYGVNALKEREKE